MALPVTPKRRKTGPSADLNLLLEACSASTVGATKVGLQQGSGSQRKGEGEGGVEVGKKVADVGGSKEPAQKKSNTALNGGGM